ncbi:hypothetical protein Pint_26718 [Pistacia integerrima]|uniref:Uncharacterized protein n=1 Tax=Pistacia integerrima TaxID=434235 RepID=A0ACC0YQW5_9ROSI|nr:hypothetical protein Pint_26718 [Pistacia integerrima]
MCLCLKLMELHPIINLKGMNSLSTQFATPSRLGIYEPIHQLGTWGENFKSNGNPNTSTPMIVEVDTKLDTQRVLPRNVPPSNKYKQEASKPVDKIQRRLAQNCEAARKSRLQKNVGEAYVQHLESSRLKLVQLEQELK